MNASQVTLRGREKKKQRKLFFYRVFPFCCLYCTSSLHSGQNRFWRSFCSSISFLPFAFFALMTLRRLFIFGCMHTYTLHKNYHQWFVKSFKWKTRDFHSQNMERDLNSNYKNYWVEIAMETGWHEFTQLVYNTSVVWAGVCNTFSGGFTTCLWQYRL